MNLSFLTLLGITGLAFADPVLLVFGASPELFSHLNLDSGPWIVGFAVAVVFAVPVALWLLLRVFRSVNQGLAGGVAALIAGALALAWGLQFGKWSLALTSTTLITLLGVFCAAGLVAALRWSGTAHALLKILALVPVVSLVVFLSRSETSELMNNLQDPTAGPLPLSDYPSVLFILLDELSTNALLDDEGAVDADLFPNLAALSAQSTWYTRYTVLADSTSFSVPSLLSGTPPADLPATASAYPTNLFALLAPTHNLVAYETITSLCVYPRCTEGKPGEVRKAVPQPLEMIRRVGALWLTRVSPGASGVSARDDFQEALVVDTPAQAVGTKTLPDVAALLIPEKMTSYVQAKPRRLERFKDTLENSAVPALYFMHLELPHAPWRFYDDGAVYGASTNRFALSREFSNRVKWMIRVSKYRFMMQAVYTDRLVGEVIAQARAKGLWDDMLVVVTSDHGRSFKLNSDHRRAQRDTLDQIAYVPLFVKQPGQVNGNVDASNLMAFDLLPTIAAGLGIEPPWPLAGLPAGDRRIRHRAQRKQFYINLSKSMFDRGLGEKKLYLATKHFPTPLLSLFQDMGEGETVFNRLVRELNAAHYIGKPVSGFQVHRGGDVNMDDLDKLRRPGDSPPPGFVIGNLAEAAEDDEVLVAINGRFVSASPVFKFRNAEGTFLAMLPNGVLGDDNEVGVYSLREGALFQLRVR